MAPWMRSRRCEVLVIALAALYVITTLLALGNHSALGGSDSESTAGLPSVRFTPFPRGVVAGPQPSPRPSIRIPKEAKAVAIEDGTTRSVVSTAPPRRVKTKAPATKPPTDPPEQQHELIPLEHGVDGDHHVAADPSFKGLLMKASETHVKDHPGGTEAEALKERRKLSKQNWPFVSWRQQVWRTRKRPDVPWQFLIVQQEEESRDTEFDRAMQLCNPHNDASLDLDFSCLLKQYPPVSAKPDINCDRVYGYGLIRKFQASDHEMCAPSKKNQKETDEVRSRLDCMSFRVTSEHNIDTAICRATNAIVDFNEIPDGDFPWLSFQPGAFSLSNCVDRPHTAEYHWGFMHCLRDWMDLGLRVVQGKAAAQLVQQRCDEWIEHPVMFITRSGDYSPFAMAHDWLNTVITFAAANVSREKVQLVMMDRMTVGFYSPVWQAAFGPSKELLWFPDLREKHQRSGKALCLKKVILNIPARLSPLYNHDACERSSLLRFYSDFLLREVGALYTSPIPTRIVVTLIIRRNYQTGHPIGRRIANPEKLTEAIRGLHQDIVVNALDYADFDFDQQLNISRSTDVLVGMHGAGLIQLMFLPRHGGVFEFFCPDRPSSNDRYNQLARHVGLQYSSYSIESDDNTVPIDHALPAVDQLIKRVRDVKKGNTML